MIKLRISVIIPVYNGALLLKRCLDSVYNQSGDFNIEVIVIDDGSTDNSVEIIRGYSRPVRLLLQTNMGPAAARNKGIKIATGKYLAFLDADDYWLPGFLKATTEFLEFHKEAVAVSVGQIHKTVSCPYRLQPSFLKEDITNSGFIIQDLFALWLHQEIICTGSVLMITNIAKIIGGQREDLRITEDIEFWVCVAAYGRWGFYPKVLFVSDGTKIARLSGWVKKNKKRWASAPSIEVWERRINLCFGDKLPESYSKFKGKILRNLTYSMILSKRTRQAYYSIRKYRSLLPDDKLSVVLKIASNNWFLWIIITKSFIIREHFRIIKK